MQAKECFAQCRLLRLSFKPKQDLFEQRKAHIYTSDLTIQPILLAEPAILLCSTCTRSLSDVHCSQT